MRQHTLSGLLAGLCLLLALAGHEMAVALRFDWVLIQDGQWWRFLSGHFVHLGWSHTLMNVAALALMSVLFANQLSIGRWALIVLFSATGVSLGLVFLGPALGWYVGLSGVLHGIFAAGLAMSWRARPGETLVLGVALLAKLAYEYFQGALPGSEVTAGGPVIVEAHLYGAIAGAITGLVFANSAKQQT